MKIVLTLVMMLVWGIGKEVAQKLQGSGFGFMTLIVSLVCTWVIYDIWFGSFIFSKKSEKSDSPVQNAIVNEGYLKTINNTSNSMPEKQLDIPFQTHKQDSVKRSEPIMNKNEHSEVINEDELYLQATQEVDEGNQDKALWAKCMALCEGDEGKAKYKYIKERVDRIAKETMKSLVAFKINKNDAVISEKSINDENDKHVDNLVITFGVVIFLCVAIAMLFFV
ncbi:MAG: hypothetical protein LHW64_09965 [Candidatus Cloacimonetes bacterium]|nr:hypothetical protein [Candidatus Cloacimonadota bacterium]MDY0230437.1 hypothetical protein [Candidatus Cloacimonadaceae bacterium]